MKISEKNHSIDSKNNNVNIDPKLPRREALKRAAKQTLGIAGLFISLPSISSFTEPDKQLKNSGSNPSEGEKLYSAKNEPKNFGGGVLYYSISNNIKGGGKPYYSLECDFTCYSSTCDVYYSIYDSYSSYESYSSYYCYYGS